MFVCGAATNSNSPRARTEGSKAGLSARCVKTRWRCSANWRAAAISSASAWSIFVIFLSITPTSSRKFWSATRAATSKGAFCGRTGTFLGKDCSREGDFWLRQRRLVQPGFHRARIAAYAVTMVQYAQRMLEGWRDGEERDVHQEMIRLTLQIVAKTLFDADVAGDARDVGKSLELLLELGADFRRTLFVPHWVPTPTNLRIKREIAFIEGILHRIISERRACGRDTGDLLSMLLHAQDEDGSRMTDQQLRDEAITLFLAGHETTASSLSWTWWLLAQNPAAEAKLHAELDEVLVGRAPSIDDLARLPYTANVITESMRLYPPAWGLARVAIEDHELGGYPVRKGMGVAMAQWVVQRDTRWYDKPEEFRPERWEGDFAKRIPRFAYFPFGGGPRQCIGNSFALMEARLILATIAQKYRLHLVPDHPVVPLASITLRPRYGVRVVLESRQPRVIRNLSQTSQTTAQTLSAD